MPASVGNHLFDRLHTAQEIDLHNDFIEETDLITNTGGPSREDAANALLARPNDSRGRGVPAPPKPKTMVERVFGFNDVKFHYEHFSIPGQSEQLSRLVSSIFRQAREGKAAMVDEARSPNVREGGFDVLIVWAEYKPIEGKLVLPEEKEDKLKETGGPGPLTPEQEERLNTPSPFSQIISDELDY